jgi:hypothetical protein
VTRPNSIIYGSSHIHGQKVTTPNVIYDELFESTVKKSMRLTRSSIHFPSTVRKRALKFRCNPSRLLNLCEHYIKNSRKRPWEASTIQGLKELHGDERQPGFELLVIHGVILTDLWILWGFSVGRRYTQALGCLSSSEGSRVRPWWGWNFSPYLLGGACY